MSQAWRVLAQNYAKFDTPLRPNTETLEAVRGLLTGEDPLVVVLGGTPIFAELARRVWFVDVAGEALNLVAPTTQQLTIRKNWLDAADEFARADLIVGDASINAVDSTEAAERLLRLLATTLRPGATLALRVFVKHELPADVLRDRLTSAFARGRFSEVRLLVYGVVAGADGLTPVAEVDRYIANLGAHLGLDRDTSGTYRAAYFAWRGMSVETATAITTKAFFPSRTQIETMFAAAGLRVSTVPAGTFPLAECTPIYAASGTHTTRRLLPA